VNLPGQLLSISLVLFLVSLASQADSMVTCECSTVGLAALVNMYWVSYEGIVIIPSS
jgi:phage-related holin